MHAKEIRELVRIVEESQIGELEITYWWGRKIRISKAVSAGSSRGGGVEIVTSTRPAAVTPQPHHSPAAVAEDLPQSSGNYLEVKAPMVGTFYRASAPDAEPYVREGETIAPGKVLCIIEAMKLMNEIEAEISGKVVKILVQNGQPVEYNQTLFLVEPAS
ncbi:MAG TPA: acetyl-CoA carboxylase biotin carboxyl carrier protein [bacterium]|nr:acetyl-CoA carboxylase biotin carboxyl carrier protein [bacterium]HQG46118.1 acetyl-CoA carboxylase biotin carboxyl carrier protein [bacterium]HQI48474.1 acetyl-CoA carboxylase biotin carboxyl carrier protein [bacterium]HQJ64947.1 acetyl-CoA carboxylase biotin carboxyl carrier protein [bacterium]